MDSEEKRTQEVFEHWCYQRMLKISLVDITDVRGAPEDWRKTKSSGHDRKKKTPGLGKSCDTEDPFTLL